MWKEEEAGILSAHMLQNSSARLPVSACSCPDPAQAKGTADSKFGEEKNT